jgi:iron complex outermembrane recepter protein
VRAPESLANVPGIADLVFPSLDQSILEEWQPEDRVNLTGTWDRGPVGLTVAVNRYGEYTVEEGIGASLQRQTYGAKTLVDLQLRYAFDDQLSLRVGGFNIFDTTPDKNLIGQARGGRIVDGEGNVIVDSPGVFRFSRRSAPFGFNGAHFYAGLNYDF